jgi:HK97 gp10 family phage protein
MFSLEIDGLKDVMNSLKQLENITKKDVIGEFNKVAFDIVSEAKRRCPVDKGALRNSISHEMKGYQLEITASASYAAYVEFGTRKYAAKYVASLPPNWRAYAATFKGRTGGGTDKLLRNIMEWVKRKGIGGSTTKSGRVSKSKGSLEAMNNAAYIIAVLILQNGIKAQPYLYPAVTNNIGKLVPRLKKLYDRLK